MEITLALLRSGRIVLRPLSGALRYDLAVDPGGGALQRIQCKTGKLRRGAIVFRVCSADGRRPRGIPYQGQVEAFGVYCPDTGRSYLVPMTAIDRGSSTARLRVEPARNGQSRRIRLAEDFAI